MKIDRLLSIITYLSNNNRVKAQDLAEKLEVSIRTIYRDIEAINLAGIPIITYQGTNGGIGIAEGYKLDKNLLTSSELAAIVSALKSVSTSYNDYSSQILLEKLKKAVPASQIDSFNIKTQQLFVDLSPWGKSNTPEEKISQLKKIIEGSKTVLLTYCDANGNTEDREVEPYTLVLKGQKWYLYAFCKKRNAFRFFKISRIKDMQVQNSTFNRQEINLEELPWDKDWYVPKNLIHMVLKFDKSMKAFAEEWFGAGNIHEDESENCIVTAALPEDNWVYGFILSFGTLVEVIEPKELRDKIKSIAKEICKIYQNE